MKKKKDRARDERYFGGKQNVNKKCKQKEYNMQNSYAQICMLSPLAIFCQFTAKIDSIVVIVVGRYGIIYLNK